MRIILVKDVNGLTAEPKKKLRLFLERIYAASGYQEDHAALAEDAMQYMHGIRSELSCDIDVRVIKGGTYKIKEYYLENNELADIRGASSIITEVQEKIVPDLLWHIFGFDCVIYSGGGNMPAVFPAAKAPENIAQMLEQAAERCLLKRQLLFHMN